MANVIRNMNFRPIIEKVEYKKLEDPKGDETINMRVWDELKVERLRSDAVRVVLKRNVKPEPKTIFEIELEVGLEVVVNTAEYDKLDDPEDYFKDSPVARVLASTIALVLSELTLHSQIGTMITAPVVQLPQ